MTALPPRTSLPERAPVGPVAARADRRHWPVAMIALGVLFAPRWAGRQIARRGLPSAVLVHLVSMAGFAAILMAAPIVAQDVTIRTVPSSAGPSLADILRAALLGSGGPTTGVIGWLLIVLPFLLGEVYSWASGLALFGPYLALNLSQRRLFHAAAVVTGYASTWLLPLGISWGAAIVLFRLNLSTSDPSGEIYALGMCACVMVLPAWMLAMALRIARGAGEAMPEDPRPEDPLCEACGYNLHATPFGQRCPECGEPAAGSLSTIGRVCAWETGRQGYLATAIDVLRDPRRFFRSIRVHGQVDAARRFLTVSAALSAALLGTAIIAAWLITSRLRGQNWPPRYMAVELACVAMVLSGLWAVGVLIGSMMAASVVANGSRRRGDRLGPTGAMKVCCYLSALALPWSVLVGILLSLTLFLRGSGGYAGRTFDGTYLLAWALIGVSLLVWYWLAGARAYESTQYANT